MRYVLYRAIKGRGPRLSDFWSDFAHGEEPFPVQIKEPLEWSGVSTSIDPNKTLALGRLMRHQAIVVLDIETDTKDVIVRQTGKRNVSHYSVMATPSTLLSFVVQIVPIIDEGTP